MPCPSCGYPNVKFRRRRLPNGGEHIGAVCAKCRRFIKWLNRDEKLKFSKYIHNAKFLETKD